MSWRKITANDRNGATVLSDIADFLVLDKVASATNNNFKVAGVSAQNSAVVETITITCLTASPATFSVVGSITGVISNSTPADVPFQSDYVSFTPLGNAAVLVNDVETVAVSTLTSPWSVLEYIAGAEGEPSTLNLLSVGASGVEQIHVYLETYENVDTGVRNYNGLRIRLSTTPSAGFSDWFYIPFSQLDNDLTISKTFRALHLCYTTNFTLDTIAGAGMFDRFSLPIESPQPFFCYGSAFSETRIEEIESSPANHAVLFDRRFNGVSGAQNNSTCSCFLNETWIPAGLDGRGGFGDNYISSRHIVKKYIWYHGEVVVVPMVLIRGTWNTTETDGTLNSNSSEYYGDSLVAGQIDNIYHLVGGVVTGALNIVNDRVFVPFRTPQNTDFWMELV